MIIGHVPKEMCLNKVGLLEIHNAQKLKACASSLLYHYFFRVDDLSLCISEDTVYTKKRLIL